MISLLTINGDPPTKLQLLVEPGSLPANQRKRIALLHSHWSKGLQWVLKEKWGIRADDFNPRKKLDRLLKPFGFKLLGLLDLCYELHPNQAASSRYESSVSWFEAIARELWWADAEACIHGSSAGTGKKALQAHQRQMVKALQNGENPLSLNEQPHSWLLFELGLRMATELPEWDKEHWRPMLARWQTFIKSLDRQEWEAINCIQAVSAKGGVE